MSTVQHGRSNRRALVAQEQLLPFLLDPASYPHRPRTVRMLQTHSSFVFIAAPYVYKVKKPVNFGFLDFSTLKARRHFCEREVALNRRLCPGTYLGVIPICTRGQGFALGPPGHVVEYCVRMRHLSESRFLSRLVRRNAVRRADISRIVDTLARFYREQKPTPDVERWGHVGRLRISTDENFRQTRAFVGTSLSRAAFRALHLYTRRFYAQHRALLESRPRHGWIRDCHGDLHLDHIHLTPTRVSIYDCIEFNDRFRCVDVASDVAFLAMDLDFEGRPDLSRLLVEEMASALQDRAMRRLIGFYKVYRACVRGKVESFHSAAHAVSEAGRRASIACARRYFQLALRYAVAGSRPMALAVMGRAGSGKSTLAHALSEELGWSICSTDVIRKDSAGLPRHRRPDARTRRRLYSAQGRRETYRRLMEDAATPLKRGGGVILDATFGDPDRRGELLRWARSLGAHVVFLEARAPARTLRRRLAGREGSGNQNSDARVTDLPRLNRLYQAPTEVSRRQRATVHTGNPRGRAAIQALTQLVELHLRDTRRSRLHLHAAPHTAHPQ